MDASSPLKARDVMTRHIVSARPDMPTRQVARLLVDNHISAVPVIDEDGMALGMVSEGDLIGRNEMDREARRDWWLELIAQDPERTGPMLSSLQATRTARDIMSAPIIMVGEDTGLNEIAQVLATYRVKRVPVVRDGRVVGIVSRADLLRALAQQNPAPAAAPRSGIFGDALALLDKHFLHPDATAGTPPSVPPPDEDGLSAKDFQGLVSDHEQQEAHHRLDARRAAAEQRRQRVASLIDHHVSDAYWRSLLHQAREAAEHGEKEFMLLRFPSQLCSDGGRAINVTEPGWPGTLRGEAAEVYLRWERDLKPRGFHLVARILEFPDGKPGDVGLFIVWSK